MFEDRIDAGRKLAAIVPHSFENAVVVGLPRGGVVVAKEVARALQLPLTLIVIRKIGSPNNKEFGIGAVGPKRTVYYEKDHIEEFKFTKKQLQEQKYIALKELKIREAAFKKYLPKLSLKNKTVLLVDDGVATGSTIIGAAKYLSKIPVKEIVLAVPVISNDIYDKIVPFFDTIVALQVERELRAVGRFYKEFEEVSEEDVIVILNSFQDLKVTTEIPK